jgi:hypothetical protein
MSKGMVQKVSGPKEITYDDWASASRHENRDSPGLDPNWGIA